MVPVYVDDAYGEGLIPFLRDALQEVDARIPYRSVISPWATDVELEKELYKLMTMQTRVFVLHMYTDLGGRLLTKAKEIGMMEEGYVWIMTNVMTNDLSTLRSDYSSMDFLQGVLGIKTYVPQTKELKDFRVRWRRKFHQENPATDDFGLNVFGLWAYDAAEALARAVEEVGSGNLGYKKANNVSNDSSTDLETFGVSKNGPQLGKALSRIRFTGLAGDFRLVNRQLDSSTFEIVNINGNGERVVGFWTPQKGLLRNLSLNTTSKETNLSGSLGPIIWPGDSSSNPKGWEIPTNEKKLRIGVEIKGGLTEFVEVKHDNATNKTEVTGYGIEVFEAVVKALPYSLPFEYVPYAKPNGESNGTYDDLVYEVHLGVRFFIFPRTRGVCLSEIYVYAFLVNFYL